MKKSLFLSTLIAATALTLPAWALDGEGTESSPYYGTIQGTEIFSTTETTTVYIGTATEALGGNGTNSYFAGHSSNTSYYVSNLVINAGGIYITNGNGSDYHYYSGTITGTGDWTVTWSTTGTTTNDDVTQRYAFIGDLSGWSGNLTIYTVNTSDYVYYGNGNVAATNTNVSGNGGSIAVNFGTVQYNYTGYAEGTSATALTVTNSSIEANKVTFTGSVNYEVSSTVKGWDGTENNRNGVAVTASNSTLTVSNIGTTTFTGKVSNFDIVTVGANSTLAIASGGSLDLSGTTVTLASSISNSGSITVSESTSFVIDGITMGTTSEGNDYYVVIDGSSGTGSISGTVEIGAFTAEGVDSYWSVYSQDGYLVIYGEASDTPSGGTSENLVWAGTDTSNVWNTSDTNTIWNDADSGDSGYAFTSEANVTFNGSGSSTVTLGEAITAGTINFSDGSYTVSGDFSLTAETLSVHGSDGTTVTIATSSAEFDSINFTNHGNDKATDDYKHLVIGDGETATTVTAGSLSLLGQSEISVAANSTLTVDTVTDGGGYHVSIAGEGTFIATTSVTIEGNGSNEVSISVADFQAGTVTLNNGGAVTISSVSFKAGEVTFNNSAEVTISSASFTADSAKFTTATKVTFAADSTAVIGEVVNSQSGAHTVEIDGSLTTGSFDRDNGQLTLVVNGTLTVDQTLAGDGTGDGYLSFAKGGNYHFGAAQTLSGTGTVNVYGLQYSPSGADLTISVANLNIGEGGIVKGDNSGSGSLVLSGTTLGLYKVSTLNISEDMTVGEAGATFNTNSGEALTLSGAITGNGLVAKTGDGDLTIAGTSTFTNGLTVSAGTLSVAANASLTLGGEITLASAISNSGTIIIADSTSFVISGLEMNNNGSNDYYVLITGGDGASLSGTIDISAFSGVELTGTWSVYSENGYLVIYGEAQTVEGKTDDNLVWAGTTTDYTWNADSSTNTVWQNADGDTGYYFTDGNNVTFGAEGANTTVAVEGEVTAGSTTINGAYTFAIAKDASVTTGALTIADGGSLALTGSGKIVTQAATNANTCAIAFDASNFTGEMDFTEGFLDIANSTFNSEATVVVTAETTETDSNTGVLTSTNVSLFVGNAESNSTSEFAASLVLEGEGGVMIRTGTSDKNVTFSGSVTGTNARLQLNGGGNATFTNTVNVGTYTNYQGATTFTNATTLGTLEIYKTDGNAGDVTFTGSNAQATVTDLVVAQAGGSDAATLTVSSGASLSVETMTVNHDFAITIDNAAMSITSTVTQASSTSTSVTISNGGTLELGSGVSLNVAAMEIILGTSDIASTNGVSPTADGTAILTGSGTLTSDAAIAITVDEALASVLGTEGTYTFDIYSGLSLDENVFDIEDILNYGTATWTDGVLTVVVGSGAIPEPSMFGVIFGLGAIGLVATRRRRRKVA